MKKKKSFNYKLWVPVIAVGLIIIISLALLLGSSTRVAFLNIEDGEVQVDTGKGWKPATDGMDLSLGDAVKTLDGSAVVILYESVIVQLDPGTEVTIEELSKRNVKLHQSSGSTWNKFAAIAGIKNFEIETPTTVATVRGTEFWVDMESVGVSEGNVNVEMEGKSMSVKGGNKAVLDGTKVVPLSPEEIRRAIQKKEMVIRVMKDIRQMEIEKHPVMYSMVKKIRNWDDSDVNRYMDRMDNGEYNPQEIKERSMIPAKSIDKVADVSEVIQEQKSQLRQLQQMSSLGPQPEPPDMPVDPIERGMPPDPLDKDSPEVPPDPYGSVMYERESLNREMVVYHDEPAMQGDQPEFQK